MEIAEDAIAAAYEGARFALDKDSERVTIPGQDGCHDPARLEVVIGRLVEARIAWRVDRMVSWVVAPHARTGRLA
jgi:hypothetical protein